MWMALFLEAFNPLNSRLDKNIDFGFGEGLRCKSSGNNLLFECGTRMSKHNENFVIHST